VTVALSLCVVEIAKAEPRAGGGRRLQGPIVNLAADAMFECLVPPFRIQEATPKEKLVAAYEELVDYYAQADVPYLFFNVNYQRTAYRSRVWDAYWDNDDPSRLTGWPRLAWLVYRRGVDPYAVCLRRCRQRGISPWLSVRMNDTHYNNDPMKTSRLWQKHPELRRVPDNRWYCGFDFAHLRVRDYYLALIEELLARYDCDGVELDWMRFPHHFKPGREAAGCEHLNSFMRRVRQLADAASARRGRPVRVAARIPAVPQFARGLGMDGVAWAREELVDMLILSPEWRPSDTDIPIERWRELMGAAGQRLSLVAATDLWLQGTPGGKVLADDLESQCGFTAAMLNRGADGIYLFNHFNRNDFRRVETLPDGRKIERNEHQALLRTAGRMDRALAAPRRHVVTFHHPAPRHMPNPTQLPATVSVDAPAVIEIDIGPEPRSGRAVLRVGLDHRPGMSAAKLAAWANSINCTPIEDLTAPAGCKPNPQHRQRVFHVACVAARMLQFNVPVHALQPGRNAVKLLLQRGEPQRIIWLEMYLVP